jgi:magnesium-transporting ATPase (P-type)
MSKLDKTNIYISKIKKHIMIYWLIFILITVYQFIKYNMVINHLYTVFPETQEFTVRSETAKLLLLISFYLMLSTIIVYVKNEKIKACYYILSIILILISCPLIDKYYYLNSFLTKYEWYHPKDIIFTINSEMIWNPRGAFFNPSLLPLLVSIVVLFLPLISKYLISLKED